MRAFNLALAETVEDAATRGLWPLVVGGDCSVMLGALAGLRRRGPLSLAHIDGHSDFRHPGNYDTAATLGAVAGMDLALATGRGEALMTMWPEVSGALVPDAQVVQIGERENRNADFAWPDINDTAITRIDVFEAREREHAWVLQRTFSVLDRQPTWPFWIHFDVDVLDQAVLPAVDTPGSPGIATVELIEILRALVASCRCAGMTLTIFDPDLDKDGQYAALIVRLVSDVFYPANVA
jgi:arginase